MQQKAAHTLTESTPLDGLWRRRHNPTPMSPSPVVLSIPRSLSPSPSQEVLDEPLRQKNIAFRMQFVLSHRNFKNWEHTKPELDFHEGTPTPPLFVFQASSLRFYGHAQNSLTCGQVWNTRSSCNNSHLPFCLGMQNIGVFQGLKEGQIWPKDNCSSTSWFKFSNHSFHRCHWSSHTGSSVLHVSLHTSSIDFGSTDQWPLWKRPSSEVESICMIVPNCPRTSLPYNVHGIGNERDNSGSLPTGAKDKLKMSTLSRVLHSSYPS